MQKDIGHPEQDCSANQPDQNPFQSFHAITLLASNAQLTDGGPPVAPELPNPAAGPPFGGASGSAFLALASWPWRNGHRCKHLGHSKYRPLSLACISGTL